MTSKLFRHIIICIIFFNIHNASGQLNISPIWCFGSNAGLDFRSNPPRTFTTPLVTSEGSAGATDGKGELLFYTDGRFVYNKNNQIMPGGTGLTGSPSSSQSAIVLQHPSQKKDNQFYIFTVPEYAGSEGFCYSIVDMDENNGLGDVVIKNVPLFNDVLSEQMQPAMHSNGVDYWIVIKGWDNNKWHSYLIDQNGVSLKQTASLGNFVDNTIGCMRFNQQFNKFAYTCYDYSGYFQICDFNNTTGVVSNAVVVDNLYDPYGVSFSPNGKLLYVSHLLTKKVNQYNLSKYNSTDIRSSVYSLTSASFSFGNLNFASNGNLYMAVTSQNYLACIEDPNKKGSACNFKLDAVSLGNNKCTYGLPLFYDYPKLPLTIENSGNCIEDSILFSYKPLNPNDTPQWLLDTGTGFFNITQAPSWSYKFNQPGNYFVKLVLPGDSTVACLHFDFCKGCRIKIPNVFTPDSDEYNDRFNILFDCYHKDFKLYMYDRWGIKLFESDDPSNAWDGTYNSRLCPSGVYYYIINYKDVNNENQTINGVAHLIR